MYIGTNADAKARAGSSQRVHRHERGREGASGQLAATCTTRATGSHSASPTTRTGEGGRDSGELGATGRVEEAERQKERGGDVLLYSPP